MRIHNFDHLAPSPAPVVVCVECGCLMRAEWQPGLLTEGAWQVTCDTDPTQCDLAGYTLSASQYPPANLAAYRESGRKRRIKRLAAAVLEVQRD